MKKMFLGIFVLALNTAGHGQATNTFPSTGNAGIGTTSPLNGLHIFSNNNFLNGSIRFGHSTSNDGVWSFGYNSASAADALKFSVFPHSSTSSEADLFTILLNGNVGINTTNPQSLLHVNGNIFVSQGQFVVTTSGTSGATGGNACFAVATTGTASNAGYSDVQAFYAGSGYTAPMVLQRQGGNVLIGKASQANTAYLLDVNGFIHATKLVVNSSGADFVFEPGYKLAPLGKVEECIKTNHYLPGIAPAAQMQKDGLDVGSNQTNLLQKIEELTLYIIDQDKSQKQQAEQQAKINEQQNKIIEAQGKMLQQLQKQIAQMKTPKQQ